MSKYIKTKDGIYEAKKNKVGAWITKLPYKIFDRDIIKQANTIEELVDEFVYCDKDDKPYVIKDLELNKSFLENRKQDKIYGEIWIDGELHKVAKMNKEGKLELLYNK